MSSVPSEKKDHVLNLMKEGRKIEAIKYVRNEFGLSLQKAKEFIDHLSKDYPEIPSILTERVSSTKVPFLIGLIFDGIGTLFLVIAAWSYINTTQQIEKSILATGEVVEMNRSGSGYAPVIAYNYEGEEYSYYSNVYSNPPSYALGEQVEIYVDPTNPNDGLINTYSEKWLFVTIFGGIGAVFVMIGLAAIVFSKKFSTTSKLTP